MVLNIKKTLLAIIAFILLFCISYFAWNQFYPIKIKLHLKEIAKEQTYLVFYETAGFSATSTGRLTDNVVSFRVPAAFKNFSFSESLTNINEIYFNDQNAEFDSQNISFNIKSINDAIQKVKPQILLCSLLTALAGIIILTLIYFLAFSPKYKKAVAAFIHKHLKLIRKLEITIVVLFLVILALSFIMHLNPFYRVHDLHYFDVWVLDFSWIWALDHMAYNPDFVFGRDVTFTYGPLGHWIAPLKYAPNGMSLFLNAFCIGMLIVLFIVYLKQNRLRFPRLTFFAVMFIFFFFVPRFEWIWNILLLLILVNIVELRNHAKTVCFLSVVAGLMSGISLYMKFSEAVMTLGLCGLLGILLLIFLRKDFLRYFCTYTITYLVTIIVIALIYFNSVHTFIQWIRISLDITSQFNYAHARPGPPAYLWHALVVTIPYCALIILSLRKGQACGKILAVLSIPFMFIAFKHAFVTADGHMIYFFSTLPYIAGLLFLYARPGRSMIIPVLFAAIAIICSGYTNSVMWGKTVLASTYDNISDLSHIKSLHAQNAQYIETELAERYTLPDEWRDMIGDNSIHILPWDLVYADVNRLSGWRPNPILQTYSIYTDTMDIISANAYTGPQAPDYVLLHFQEFLDTNNFFIRTPATYNTILANYEIVAHDNFRALLLRKSPAGQPPTYQTVGIQEISWLQAVDMPEIEQPLYLKIHTQYNLWGKMAATFFRGSPSYIIIRQNSREHVALKIIDSTAQSPILISNVPVTQNQIIALLKNEDLRDFSTVQFAMYNPRKTYFKKTIRLEWLVKTAGNQQ